MTLEAMGGDAGAPGGGGGVCIPESQFGREASRKRSSTPSGWHRPQPPLHAAGAESDVTDEEYVRDGIAENKMAKAVSPK